MIRKICLAAALIGTPASVSAQEVVNSNWKYSEEADPLTDVKLAAIYSEGEGGTIILKCDKPGVKDIYWQFSSKEFLGGDFEARFMDWRVDSNPPVREMWEYKRSLAIFQSGPLVTQMVDGQSLYIRAMKYDGRFVEAKFAIGGFKEAFARFIKVCLPGH